MKFLLFDTPALADSYSEDRQAEKPLPVSSTTDKAFVSITHPNTGKGALIIPDGEEGTLPEADQPNLKSKAQMISWNWFG